MTNPEAFALIALSLYLTAVASYAFRLPEFVGQEVRRYPGRRALILIAALIAIAICPAVALFRLVTGARR